jgi:hypothetical protein
MWAAIMLFASASVRGLRLLLLTTAHPPLRICVALTSSKTIGLLETSGDNRFLFAPVRNPLFPDQ